VGAKKFQYKISILIVQFVEIRYENSARVADRLSIGDFHSIPSG